MCIVFFPSQTCTDVLCFLLLTFKIGKNDKVLFRMYQYNMIAAYDKMGLSLKGTLVLEYENQIESNSFCFFFVQWK